MTPELLTVIVADDERPARRFLIGLLKACTGVQLVGEAGSGEEAVALIQTQRPHLALLDLQMPEIGGLDVGRRVPPDLLPLIAFVTAFDDHAIEAFELNAIDYLLKPVQKERLQQTAPESSPLLKGYTHRLPDITFSQRLTLYLGNHTFELIHLPGHTPGQVGVHIPQERIFFTGDNFANGWQPSLAYACPLEWLESLRKIEALDAEVVVPGHGMVGDKKALRKFRAFLEEYISAVRKAIDRGMSQEEAVDTISFESAAYPPALHPGPKSQRDNVMRLYEMLTGF